MRRARFLIPTAALVLALSTAGQVQAHDDPDHRLAELSARIDRHPEDARLRLQRAELHRFRGDWSAGMADLQAASRLDPALAVVDLATADLLLDADNPTAALEAADRFLVRQPASVQGHRTRARILLKLGALPDAAASFTRAIRLDGEQRGDAGAIQPDDYLQRARALAATGRVDEALRGLDEGLAALGEPVTLQLLAIELEETRGRREEAARRVARIEARSQRKEIWMARRGDLLAGAGRLDDAALAYRDALAAIEALPPRLRQRAATPGLEADLRRKLGTLDPSRVNDERSERFAKIASPKGCFP